MSNQVAGHNTFKFSKETLIKTTTEEEAQFYKELSNYPQYDRFTPDFTNIVDISSEEKQTKEQQTKDKCIYLENLIWQMEKPCVMDIKLGIKNYRDDASIERIIKNIFKAHISTTAKWGLRIAGLKYLSGSSWIKKDKLDCRQLSIEEVQDEIHNFFLNSVEMVKEVKGIIENILDSLKDNHLFRLYGSSILFVYDATNPLESIDIRLIDFSNYYKLKYPDEQDDGYIFGLKNLYNLL